MPNRDECGATSMRALASHGTRRMLLAGLLLLAMLAHGHAATVLDELRGQWSAVSGGPVVMDWVPVDNGFRLTWTPAGHEPVTVQFTSTGRPGVYAGRGGEGWSMFGGDGPVNPLVGGTLFWARLADGAIYVYSLAIGDHGDFQLDRYACTRNGDTLTVSLLRRTAAGMGEPVEQKLMRVNR